MASNSEVNIIKADRYIWFLDDASSNIDFPMLDVLSSEMIYVHTSNCDSANAERL